MKSVLVPISKLSILLLAAGLLFGLGGCVSSTLDSSQFRPVGTGVSSVPQQQAVEPSRTPVALNPNMSEQKPDTREGFDAAGKAAAISEMRAKGQQSTGQKTHIGALPETAADQLTINDRTQMSADLAQKVEQSNSEITDIEIASKQESIRRLQQKAKTHYQSAVRSIEN